MSFPVFVQHRHIHLSQDDFVKLFGDRSWPSMTPLGHFGQFVTGLMIAVHSPTGWLDNVHVLGPSREHSQVELTASEARALGLDIPVRVSGDLVRSGNCVLKNDLNEVAVSQGVIIPARHLHVNEQTAKRLELHHGQTIRLQVLRDPSVKIDQVTVRVHPTFCDSLHLNADEAAKFWLDAQDRVDLCV
ncbi:hypothetical protein HZA85_03665 [Candidatus Uhrbacteria bacterium]|nr:hypothetical protein [Candidatus Uhrbacteria bacterium]